MPYFLGIDGGGSTTRAVLITETREVLGRGEAGASNHYAVGAQVAADNCRLAAEQALADACRVAPGLTPQSITAWGFGLAGVRRESDAFIMRGRLADLVGRTPWILDTDAAAAHAGALAGQAGVILIAGTGAVALGVNRANERFYADGWGPLLGDEGSGYWIGLEALRETCRGADGRAPKSGLGSAVLTALGLPSSEALIQWVSGPEVPRDQVARLAQLVFDRALAGEAAALEIRERAALHLAQTASAVAVGMIQRHQETAPGVVEALGVPFALCGGLFEDDHFKAVTGYAIGEKMVELKRKFQPLGAWQIIKPQYDAAIGAALLAQKTVRAQRAAKK